VTVFWATVYIVWT